MNSLLYRWKCALLRGLYARVPFRAGQMWGFESPERSRTARLVVYRVDADDRHVELVSVVPSGTWVPVLTNTQGEHALFLTTRSALRQSVTHLIARNATLPDVDGEYRYIISKYREGETGVFDRPLREWLEVYRLLDQRKQQVRKQDSDGQTVGPSS
jgi:hypothetical protein